MIEKTSKEGIFHIVLIPNKEHRKLLNNLQNDFYIWWFRYTNKPRYSDIHITLTQLNIDNNTQNIIEKLKQKTQQLLKKHKASSLKYHTITKEVKSWENNSKLKIKCPNWRWRVSLLFNNKDNLLWELTTSSIKITEKLNINNIQSYIDKIKTFKPKDERTDNILDYTANHLNICNYCLPDRTEEIHKVTKETIPEKIIFDTIALRDFYWNHIFEIQF